MSSLTIRFDPPIALAAAPATQSWIDAIDWDEVKARDTPEPEYNIHFHIDDQWLEFVRQSLAGVLENLVDIHRELCRDREGLAIIEGADILMGRRYDLVVQFAELVDWERSPTEMPDELNPHYVGDAIPWEAVDLAVREAIAAVWQQLNVTSARQ